MRMENKTPHISAQWKGQDGRNYRSISFWVGAGWTSSFLQREDTVGWRTLY